jgi:hypothetical protein
MMAAARNLLQKLRWMLKRGFSDPTHSSFPDVRQIFQVGEKNFCWGVREFCQGPVCSAGPENVIYGPIGRWRVPRSTTF